MTISTPSDTMSRQITLEHEMRGLGQHAYMQRALKATERGRASTTEGGVSVAKHLLGPFITAVNGWREDEWTAKSGRKAAAARLIALTDTSVACYLTLRAIIDGAARQKPLAAVAVQIGDLIEDDVMIGHAAGEMPQYVTKLIEALDKRTSDYSRKRAVILGLTQKKGVIWSHWTHEEKLHLGSQLVSILSESTGFVAIETFRESRDNTVKMVTLTPPGRELLDRCHDRSSYLSPLFLPTITPPKPWTTPVIGGYWSDVMRRHTRLVKTPNRGYLDALAGVEMPVVYEAVNAMQNTAWKINTAVLEVMEWSYRANLGISDMIRADDHEIPPKPRDIDTNEESRKAWRRAAALTHEKNRCAVGNRKSMEMTLWVAHKFADEEAIYFPHNLDFRGRVYPIPLYLHPQGSDAARALIHFATPKPLGEDGAFWLALHGSGLFGYDKDSYEGRVRWVEDHADQIMACASDPYSNRWWAEADKPFCFLAFCFEWLGYMIQGADYASRLAVALDGSCNGLQHLSAMLRDETGGAAVNLVPAVKPSDIYGLVAQAVTLQLTHDAQHGTTDTTKKLPAKGDMPAREQPVMGTRRLAAHWLQFGVTRSVCKRPVMTLPYGSGEFGFRQQIMDDTLSPALRKAEEKRQALVASNASEEETNTEVNKLFPFDEDGYVAAGYLAKLVWKAANQVVKAAPKVMAWLKSAAVLAAKEELPIHWTTPAGLPVLQEYLSFKERRIETYIAGATVRFAIRGESTGLDRSSMASGIAPNFTHSCDAAHMMLTIRLFTDQVGEPAASFHMIHDSYGTHAADAGLMARCLREAFIEQYEQPVLERFRDQIAGQLCEESREELLASFEELRAEFGTLDLGLIRDSRFFFA